MPRAVGLRRQPLRVNGSNPYTPPRSPDLPDTLKQAIVAKHVEHPGLSFQTIGNQLPYLGRPIFRQTVRKVCTRALARASAVIPPSEAITLPCRFRCFRLNLLELLLKSKLLIGLFLQCSSFFFAFLCLPVLSGQLLPRYLAISRSRSIAR